MLTTDKIIAHKTSGKNLVLLTQVESSYFLVLTQIISGKKGARGSLKTIFQKQLSQAEAFAIFTELSGLGVQNSTASNSSSYSNGTLLLSEQTASSTTSSTEQIVLLLEGSVQSDTVETPQATFKVVVSPYFPTKDIFLSVQKTRAPATI